MTLTPVEQSDDKDVMMCYNWSSYLTADEGQEMIDESNLPVTSVSMESLEKSIQWETYWIYQKTIWKSIQD